VGGEVQGALRQLLVAQAGIGLQQVEQPQIDVVQVPKIPYVSILNEINSIESMSG
jgi:hypothetical protein